MSTGGALGLINLHPQPFGTLEELRQHGLDKGMVGSCAPGPKME